MMHASTNIMDIHNLRIASLIKVNVDKGRITSTQLGSGIDLLILLSVKATGFSSSFQPHIPSPL
jgi:hypothetical protein